MYLFKKITGSTEQDQAEDMSSQIILNYIINIHKDVFIGILNIFNIISLIKLQVLLILTFQKLVKTKLKL